VTYHVPTGCPLTGPLRERVQRFAAAGAPPVTPRLAATVPLLRPAEDGFQVFLLRRAAGLAFAAGVYAFPGGTVDPADRDGEPVAVPAALRLPPAEAAALLRAAVREVAEEAGVRLAPADLVPWARWITPDFEPRRYDTYFFLSLLPPGQRATVASGESDRGGWWRPAEALARADAGELSLLPPTMVVLAELAGHASVRDVLAAAADRDPARPVRSWVATADDGTPYLRWG